MKRNFKKVTENTGRKEVFKVMHDKVEIINDFNTNEKREARIIFHNQKIYVILYQNLNFEELKELRKEINRIGVNINQVAKKVNEDDQANLNELSQILELQKHLKDTVNQFIQKQENQTKEQERWL